MRRNACTFARASGPRATRRDRWIGWFFIESWRGPGLARAASSGHMISTPNALSCSGRRSARLYLAILIASSLAASCSGEDTGGTGSTGTTTSTTQVELPPPMGPIVPVEPTKTEQLATSGACSQCHYAGEVAVMHDADGTDMSPVALWRASMMAFASRDPYYLAAVDGARVSRPGAEGVIEAACLRCHAPAGSIEAKSHGEEISFEAIAKGSGAEAHLGRDGVTCSLCHQIAADNLGQTDSFSGGFEIGFDREMFGPHQSPDTQPMQFFVNYTPVYSGHITTSEVCATCHTVVVPFLDAQGQPTGDGFLEQATYIEWKNSKYSTTAQCASCHLPTTDSSGAAISSPISKYPENLSSRTPFGRHTFEGGNAYMLELLAENVDWTGASVPKEDLMMAAARGEAHLATAAELNIVSSELSGGDRLLVVEIINLTGHKLPTGYPSRRMWLHVVAEGDSGEVLFESGRPTEDGAIESDGSRIDLAGVILPHRDEVKKGQVQVFEAIAVDPSGDPSDNPLSQTKLGKDNRILPQGYSDSGFGAEYTEPVGVPSDPSFMAGSDQVTYRIPSGEAVKRVTVELLYQTLPRAAADHWAVTPAPAAVAFSQMVAAKPPKAVVMATAEWQ